MNRAKETIKAIEYLLKDIKKNGISDECRHDEINIDCGECKFRVLEGYLNWYLELLEWGKEQK